jgi:hypothetical protein
MIKQLILNYVRRNERALTEQMGDWPARLLHVPTMTSYKWKPGGLYGIYREPKYVALSYTWGRWELPSNHFPPHPALPVKGITWAVPPVSPTLFTVRDFETVLGTVAREAGCEFVWVDVACIDQKNGSKEKAREIGRQAKIFGCASKAFIWLLEEKVHTDVMASGEQIHSESYGVAGSSAAVSGRLGADVFSGNLDSSEANPHPILGHEGAGNEQRLEVLLLTLERVCETLDPLYRAWFFDHALPLPGATAMPAGEEREADDDSLLTHVGNAAHAIAPLTMIPWFSSTWTLQEAFIQPSATFLNRSGDYALSRSGMPFTLETVLAYCKQPHQRFAPSKTPITAENDRDEALILKRDLIRTLERVGLQALADNDRTTLYSYARLRQPKNENDWVYGIMQVWDFALGEASPGGSRKKYGWTLDELELELGKQLLREFPVESQMQVHKSPIPNRQS